MPRITGILVSKMHNRVGPIIRKPARNDMVRVDVEDRQTDQNAQSAKFVNDGIERRIGVYKRVMKQRLT